MDRHNIVVWDPEAAYWEGSLVGDSVVTSIRGRGGVALPVDPELFKVSGVGGYFRRGWGAGWPCDHGTPKMFCPMSIYTTPEHRLLHWAARLVPDERHEANLRNGIQGPSTITIMSYPARANTYAAPVTPQQGLKPLRELGPMDARGGWNLVGHVYANPSVEGNHAFALYGAANGLRVAWTALTIVKA